MLNLSITKLHFPGNQNLPAPITVSIYYREYYSGSYILIDTGVNVSVNGTITDSPLPTVSIDPTEKYVLKAVNEMCGSFYEQNLFINAYCAPNQTLSSDESYCFIETVIDATPPSAGENTVAKTNAVYTSCGSYIYAPGYNVNGTGTSTLISLANSYWVNWDGSGSPGDCGSNTTTEGPLNRCGLWSVSELSNQTVGFSVCINILTSKTYYIGMGTDNLGIIKLNGIEIVHQDPAALDIEYPFVGSNTVPFRIWHIYPVHISAGANIIELIGFNNSGAAAMGMQIYNNTASEIAAATSNAGLNFIFNSSDYIGMPVVLGSGGIGYSCPVGYSLSSCASPVECVGITRFPVLY